MELWFIFTLGANPSFYPEIPWKLMFEKCEFCQIWDSQKVNFVKNETLIMWILSKMKLKKCIFCDKWYFQDVNFIKNDIFKMWILSKMRVWKYEFCEYNNVQNMNFWINQEFCLSVILVRIRLIMYWLGQASTYLFEIVDHREQKEKVMEAWICLHRSQE